MVPIKKFASISENTRLSDDVYSMWLEDRDMVMDIRPGQFLSLYCKNPSYLLPRPLSVCEVDKDNGRIRLVYKIVGKGTLEFSKLKVGDEIEVMGPLGNGFDILNKEAILIGGGVGIPPLLELVKNLPARSSVILGYRDGQNFLAEDFEKYARVFIATEDGTVGTKGNVIDAIKENNIKGEMIYSCGPIPMLKAVKEFALSNNITAQISLEEKMACGIGACLACTCKTKEIDEHSKVHNKRICKEGPVFYAKEVDL